MSKSTENKTVGLSSQYSQLLKGIADKASDIYKQGKRDAINYLNDHTDEIFQDSQSDCDLRNAALDSIIELQGAIHKEVFKYLCQKRPSMIIERFDDLERVFDKAENSDLFTTLFPSGHYFPGDNQSGQKLIDSLWLQSVLDIWKKEYSKNTGRRWLIENYISELSQDAESLCDELSEWNVYEAETAVKSLCSFLKEIKSHKSDDLSEDITAVEKLEIKIRDDKVTFVQHLFDNLGAKKWRNTSDSKSKLLMLTHYHVDPGKYKSHLSKKRKCLRVRTALMSLMISFSLQTTGVSYPGWRLIRLRISWKFSEISRRLMNIPDLLSTGFGTFPEKFRSMRTG